MSQSATEKHLYADLTWPEVNDAVASEQVILLPVGSTEQHGPHLPLDVDTLLPTSVCQEAGRRAPDRILVAPAIPYGFNIHGMDFPGTIHVAYDHFVEYCVDVCKSFAYHGFKRIVIVDGHGSNEHLLEIVARRLNLESDALVTAFMWVNLLRVDPGFVESFRESVYPGGCAHACELETSVYLHLAAEKVKTDEVKDHIAPISSRGEMGFEWVDLFGTGPVNIVERTSTLTPSGVMGQPSLASAEKGQRIFEEAVNQLVRFVIEFQKRPTRPRVDHHAHPPTNPLPKV
jgi:creatinine amidohydrolase